MSESLRRVSLLARRRDRTGAEYREAVRAALEAGESQSAIARAAGVTPQAVSDMARRMREEQEQ